MIRLIVKGDALAAIQAATKRGVKVTVVRKMHGTSETMLATDDQYWREVCAWLAEPVSGVGTLLFFNAIDASLQGRP